MIIYSKQELKGMAQKALEESPQSEKVHVTNDGLIFPAECETEAKDYAANNRFGKQFRVLTFTRAEFSSEHVQSENAQIPATSKKKKSDTQSETKKRLSYEL